MKKFLLALFLLFSVGSLWAGPFELIKSFSTGAAPGDLGINSTDPTDQDPPSSEGLCWAQNQWWVLDNVNKRVCIFDHDWRSVGTVDIGSPYHFNLIPLKSGVLLVNGFDFMRPLGEIHWIYYQTKLMSSLDKKLYQFVNGKQDYSFLFQYQDVLIFQNTGDDPSYFGIKGLATTKEEPQSYLDDQQVRQLLADPANSRYHFEGDALFDHDQIVSGDMKVFGDTLANRGGDAWLRQIGFTDKYNLANNNFLFQDWKWAHVFDSAGHDLVLNDLFPDRSQTLTYSNLTPAPDGYLYQLRGDYANNETRLYRIGPFPEIMLDYHGRGGTINDGDVNLREDSNTKAAIVTRLDKGTPVRILSLTDKPETIGGQTAVWYQVRLWDHTEGWVFGAFLDLKKQE